MTELVPGDPEDPEDTKIITLAAAARARTQAAQAACLRDTDGRTYAGTAVALPHLTLTAVQVVVAMAVSSGATGVEAVALSGDPESAEDQAVLADLGCPITWRADARGHALGSIQPARS